MPCCRELGADQVKYLERAGCLIFPEPACFILLYLSTHEAVWLSEHLYMNLYDFAPVLIWSFSPKEGNPQF